MRRPSPPALLLTCALLAGGAVAAGCGDEEETAASEPAAGTTTAAEATSSGAGGAAESADQVEIVEFEFDPKAITVEAGSDLRWTNADEAPHTATADDGSFDTGTLELDASGSASFDEPGTYSYYCRFHPFMKGTVEVQ